MKKEKKYPSSELEAIITKLKTKNGQLSVDEIRSLTDLPEEKAHSFLAVWNTLDELRRESIMRTMLATASADMLLDYTAIVSGDLANANLVIRRIALNLMQDIRNSVFLDQVIHLAQTDPDPEVQKDAIEILGFFLNDLIGKKHQAHKTDRARAALLSLLEAKREDIRFQAMQALAYWDDEAIRPLIRHCFTCHDPGVLCAGLKAVQRSMNDLWVQDVLENLDHEDHTVRLEAIRAAGALQTRSALNKILLLLTQFDRLDEETLDAAILAASQIGGDEAAEMISLLEETLASDEETADLFEQAHANLELIEFESKMFSEDSEPNADSDESEYDENDFYYLGLLRERISELSDYMNDDDSSEDDDADQDYSFAGEDDSEDDLDFDDDEEDASHLHHLSHHHPFEKIEEIDWSQYRIIENWDDEKNFDDLGHSKLDDSADDFLKKFS